MFSLETFYKWLYSVEFTSHWERWTTSKLLSENGLRYKWVCVCVKSVVLKATITMLKPCLSISAVPKFNSRAKRMLSIKFQLDTSTKSIHNQKYIKSQRNHVSYGFLWNKQRFPLCIHTMANKKAMQRNNDITTSFFVKRAKHNKKKRKKEAHRRIVNIVHTRSSSTWPNVESKRVHLVCCGVFRMHWKRVITAVAYVYAILNA